MMTRKELKRRILGKYDRVEDFAADVGYGRQHVSNIIRNETVGKMEFWERARQKLELTYQEAWECMAYGHTGGGKHNGTSKKRN